MLDSQESRVNRSQGLKKEKEETFKNLGLLAAQFNIIGCPRFQNDRATMRQCDSKMTKYRPGMVPGGPQITRIGLISDQMIQSGF